MLGLLGSFHCIGMCGPIAFVLPVNKKSKVQTFFGTFLYHTGRILSYGLIGFLFGLLGKGLYLAGFQQRLSILIGLIMILVVLVPTNLLNRYHFTKPLYRAVGVVKSKLGLYLNKSSFKALFSIGFFNGFLPCGLVYMALLGAISSGNETDGAIYMAAFGLGTIPLMTGAVYLGNFLKISVRNKIQKAIPIFVFIIGVLFIIRGMGLGIPYISPSDTQLLISSDPNSCLTE
ncbi:sulfite exporter TauE/SafE family protein [Lutimonas saemankumensis]|uniref:sulfite exporter TauE/SafE family protein n=1 Tax=Lutimonas saemankumensis TaxID=483016 RepID=UPI00293D43B8|nr:sulfite exporter TauE/SafE family protein [Lutimonas saemankumensis]